MNNLPIIHVVYYLIAQAAQLFPLLHVFGAIPWFLLHYKLWSLCRFSSFLRSLLPDAVTELLCVWLSQTNIRARTLLQLRLFSWLMCSRDGALLQSTVRRIHIKTQCTTSEKEARALVGADGAVTAPGWQSPSASHLLPSRRRSDSWIMFRLLSTGTSQKPKHTLIL